MKFSLLKISLVVAISFFLISSCTTRNTFYATKYLKYKNKAEKNLINSNESKAINCYKKAFQTGFYYRRDLNNFYQLCLDRAKEYEYYMVLNHLNLKEDTTNSKDKNFKKLYIPAKNEIIVAEEKYNKLIDSLLHLDQYDRVKCEYRDSCLYRVSYRDSLNWLLLSESLLSGSLNSVYSQNKNYEAIYLVLVHNLGWGRSYILDSVETRLSLVMLDMQDYSYLKDYDLINNDNVNLDSVPNFGSYFSFCMNDTLYLDYPPNIKAINKFRKKYGMEPIEDVWDKIIFQRKNKKYRLVSGNYSPHFELPYSEIERIKKEIRVKK